MVKVAIFFDDGSKPLRLSSMMKDGSFPQAHLDQLHSIAKEMDGQLMIRREPGDPPLPQPRRLQAPLRRSSRFRSLEPSLRKQALVNAAVHRLGPLPEQQEQEQEQEQPVEQAPG